MPEERLFFHLGMPKTGSTYLQLVVFPRLKNIFYFGKRKLKDFYALVEDIGPEQTILFSHELDHRLEEYLQKISTVYPDARVILVFRSHKSWVDSRYRYYIRKHGHLPFNQYIDLEHDQGFLKKKDLCYRDRIELVEKYFNHGPYVLIFEDLKKDPADFSRQITEILGVELDESAPISKNVKKNFSLKQLKAVRWYNQFTHYKKLETGSKFINRVHYKAYEFALHIVAFFARLIPKSWFDQAPLIPDGATDKVGRYFQDDWEYVLNYKASTQIQNA